ncbi:MAG: cupredoxin domain-containing protein [Acidobacteria bacterium]|nr:cupredoxin domain-containing protein [Acidobacteriota bacterium]
MKSTNPGRIPIVLLLSLFSVVAILTLACGGDSYSSPTEPRQAGPVVTIGANHSYSPDPITISVGQSVTWRNSGSDAHRIIAVDGTFDSGTILPGYSSVAVTASLGTHPYTCSIHPTATGTMVVRN